MILLLDFLENIYTGENTYFIINGDSAAVVDPGTDADRIIGKADGKTIKYVLLTHCHYDHIDGLEELLRKTGAKLAVTAECEKNLANPDVNLSEQGLGRKIAIENADIITDEEKGFDFDGVKINVIKTPGHTSCGTCYYFDNILLSGDTLFFRNVGRWDLPTGDREVLTESIKNKIYTLPDDTAVYPGHGNNTSVGYEKKYNFFVR